MRERIRRLLGRKGPEERLLALDGVVSVGTGFDEDGAEVLVVGVEDREAVIGVPEGVDGVPVVVREVGRLKAEQPGHADHADDGAGE